MDALIKVTLPFSRADLERIEQRLSACDGIVHFAPEFPRYSIVAYHHDAAIHGHRYRALFDLNILSAALAIARGGAANETMRDVAALMAFLISFDCVVEPGMSAQEYSSLNGEKQTLENIRLFRLADNLHPALYADIACERLERLTPAHLPDSIMQPPDAFQQYIGSAYWQHYAALLKLGALLKSHAEPIDKLESYMRWQRDEFFFGACVTVFAIQALGTQPIKDPLKQSKSRRNSDPLKGVRNAAWDLSMVHYWSERVFHDYKNNVQWLLCSFDANLRELARHIIVSTSLGADVQMQRIVRAHWPVRMIDSVVATLSIADIARHDQEREMRVRATKADMPRIIKSLERTFVDAARQH